MQNLPRTAKAAVRALTLPPPPSSGESLLAWCERDLENRFAVPADRIQKAAKLRVQLLERERGGATISPEEVSRNSERVLELLCGFPN